MPESHVFHDPSQLRWRRLKRMGALLGAFSLVVAGLFLVSLLLIPYLPPIPGISSPLRHALKRSFSPLPKKDQRLRRALVDQTRKELLELVRNDRPRGTAAARAGRDPGAPIVAGFYATWQEEGLHSLRANASRLNVLMPEWVHLSPDGGSIDLYDWDPELVPHNKDVVRICRENRLLVHPVLNNAQGGRFDPLRARRLLGDPARQRRLAAKLRDWLRQSGFNGINVDFEGLDAADYARLPDFLRRLRSVFRPAGLEVSVDLEATDTPLDWGAAAEASDFVVLMAYDAHYATGKAGPIAPFPWYQKVLAHALREVPARKLVVALGNYAYDWTRGRPPAEAIGYQQALLADRDNNPDLPPGKLVDFDPKELNPTFNYEDEFQRDHEVWMLDAVTAANEWSLAQRQGARGAALWVLGSEDPSLWTFFSRDRLARPPDMRALELIQYPYDVQYVGNGEILSVEAVPAEGRRRLEIDPRSGFVVDESYSAWPAPYVIKRSGLKPKRVALTFDDGPADPSTGDVLDVLKENKVLATFFVIGENAERYPDIVEREWREGHEIGSHTYTHPNIAAVTEERSRLELNATQRALQSLLGRSTILFRPPYNADAEPASAEEVKPIVLASQLGYITVGEFIDPRDWSRVEPLPDGTQAAHGAAEIAEYVVQQVHSGRGNTVLLHDGGGDRTETIKALRLLIPRLQLEGYAFVPVSELIGRPRNEVMPAVTEKDAALIGLDAVVFDARYAVAFLLRLAFLSAIALATVRMLLVSVLALAFKRRERKRERPPQPERPFGVSVLIAAYNEAGVIGATIEAALASDRALEVVVVDDGSSDGTADAVAARFGADPRVRLLRQENQGKSAALNAARAAASGEILVCLDADTLVAPDAVSKLVRPFADPAVGAVAGNVKVGNLVNPLTRLQAIEYITNQNLERRAYAYLNAVSVVPGAAGAWRKSAVEAAGGLSSDTLAEDMDLTWRLLRAGWRIDVEPEARGYTEAPQTLATLFKQRFRWVFGTLQCLWKHRDALGRCGWFGRLAMPSMWLFQIVYQALSPLIDLQVVWLLLGFALTFVTRGLLSQDWQPLAVSAAGLYHVVLLYAFFFFMEFGGSALAFRLEGEDMRLLVWLFAQRFLYRQLMYAVVLRSLQTALKGRKAGWGKLERQGTVSAR